MATITWTAEAQKWLEDIFEFIAADNPGAAADTVQGIFERAQAFADLPLLGQRYVPSSRHIRILLYGHYRIAYMVAGDDSIVVVGVFHGALDISRYQLCSHLTPRLTRTRLAVTAFASIAKAAPALGAPASAGVRPT